MARLPAPSTRLLAGCVVAVALMLAAIAAVDVAGPVEPVRTPLGSVSWLEPAVAALSMGVGGFIARTGFRWVAVGLVAAAGIATLFAAWMLAPEGRFAPAAWLARNHGLGLLLEVGAAWLGAHAGERLAGAAASRGARRPA